MCLTETQVLINSDTTNISEILSNFTILHSTNKEKFCSLACCWKSSLIIEQHENIPSATLLRIKKETFSPYPINMLLLYRKHGVPLSSFTCFITHFLSRSDNDIQIILGDFNINGFKQMNT